MLKQEETILKQENATVACDMRITNVPLSEDENLQSILANLYNTIKIPMPDIKGIYRLHYKNNSVAPIIVKFHSSYDRNFLLRTISTFKRNNKTSLLLCHIGFNSNTKFYVNESLTAHNYRIFRTANRLRKEKSIKAVLVKRGCVYIKPIDSNDFIATTTIEDLEEYLHGANTSNHVPQP